MSDSKQIQTSRDEKIVAPGASQEVDFRREKYPEEVRRCLVAFDQFMDGKLTVDQFNLVLRSESMECKIIKRRDYGYGDE